LRKKEGTEDVITITRRYCPLKDKELGDDVYEWIKEGEATDKLEGKLKENFSYECQLEEEEAEVKKGLITKDIQNLKKQ